MSIPGGQPGCKRLGRRAALTNCTPEPATSVPGGDRAEHAEGCPGTDPGVGVREGGSLKVLDVEEVLEVDGELQMPRIEWMDPHGSWDVRRKVPGDAGHWSGPHHQRMVEDPTIAHQTGTRLGEILAELHRVITWEEARHLAPLEPPLATPLVRMRRHLARGLADATLQAQVREIFARFAALAIGAGEVVLVHGDLASQNVAFAPET
jgi:Phosphotransferase enzyme family